MKEHKKNVALRQIYDSKYYLAVKILKSVLRLEPNDILTLKRLKRIDPVFHPPLILEVGKDLNFPDFKDMVSNLLEKS